MVIGNGMIATAFGHYKDQDQYIIFASGVSDSTQNDPSAFEREKQLLRQMIADSKEKSLVYFSTCSIYDPAMQQSSYVLHKIQMEEMIKETHHSYIIFRLSNPIGNTSNQKTVINFLIKHIKTGEYFEAWSNAQRNIIDMEHVFQIGDYILKNESPRNRIINIANPENYTIPYIIRCIENHFNKKGNYKFINKGDSPQINCSEIIPAIQQLNIFFGKDYFPDLLKKYFS